MNVINRFINIEIKKSLHECHKWQDSDFIDVGNSWFVPLRYKPNIRFKVNLGLVPNVETVALFIPLCYNLDLRLKMAPDEDGMKLRHQIQHDIMQSGMSFNDSTYYCLLSANLNSIVLFKKHGVIL